MLFYCTRFYIISMFTYLHVADYEKFVWCLCSPIIVHNKKLCCCQKNCASTNVVKQAVGFGSSNLCCSCSIQIHEFCMSQASGLVMQVNQMDCSICCVCGKLNGTLNSNQLLNHIQYLLSLDQRFGDSQETGFRAGIHPEWEARPHLGGNLL